MQEDSGVRNPLDSDGPLGIRNNGIINLASRRVSLNVFDPAAGFGILMGHLENKLSSKRSALDEKVIEGACSFAAVSFISMRMMRNALLLVCIDVVQTQSHNFDSPLLELVLNLAHLSCESILGHWHAN